MKEMHWFILRASYFGRNESIKTIILTNLIIHTKILFQFCLFIVPKVLLVSNCVEGKSVQGWFSGSDGQACRIKLSGSVQQCSSCFTSFSSLFTFLLLLFFLHFFSVCLRSDTAIFIFGGHQSIRNHRQTNNETISLGVLWCYHVPLGGQLAAPRN